VRGMVETLSLHVDKSFVLKFVPEQIEGVHLRHLHLLSLIKIPLNCGGPVVPIVFLIFSIMRYLMMSLFEVEYVSFEANDF
jgi:hypothetical protein